MQNLAQPNGGISARIEEESKSRCPLSSSNPVIFRFSAREIIEYQILMSSPTPLYFIYFCCFFIPRNLKSENI